MFQTMNFTNAAIAVLHQKNVEAVGPAVERLCTRLSAAPSMGLDYGIDSLLPLNAWFLTAISTPDGDTGAGFPTWWDPKVPVAGGQTQTLEPVHTRSVAAHRRGAGVLACRKWPGMRTHRRSG